MNIARTFFFITCITVLSCKKETIINTGTNPSEGNYSCLKPGNYWIYRDYVINVAAGSINEENTFDSCYIEKDTSINGNIFYKYTTVENIYGFTPHTYSYYLRDSLSYIVSDNGRIYFSSTDFTNIFKTYTFGPNNSTGDTMIVTEQMGVKDAVIDVPAGSFKVSAFSIIFHYPPNRAAISASQDTWYAKNVGIISRSKGFYIVAADVFHEQKLVRYHVNN